MRCANLVIPAENICTHGFVTREKQKKYVYGKEMVMNSFSELSLQALGEHYVYGLLDPIENKIFYIGQGQNDRIFKHEGEADKNLDVNPAKVNKIKEIKKAGYEVGRLLLLTNLTKKQADSAEAALINAYKFERGDKLTNIMSGHDTASKEKSVNIGAILVEDFEKIYGAEKITDDYIKDEVVLIKINSLYRQDLTSAELYDVVRGCWKGMKLEEVEKRKYVLGMYNQVVVAVYQPTKWYKISDVLGTEFEEKIPSRDYEKREELKDRIFFVDDHYEDMDDNQKYYLYKDFSEIKQKNVRRTQIRAYLEPQK